MIYHARYTFYGYRTPAEHRPGDFGIREYQRYRRFADESEIHRKTRDASLWFYGRVKFERFREYLETVHRERGELFRYALELHVERRNYTMTFEKNQK
jgi:hypothetical protein